MKLVKRRLVFMLELIKSLFVRVDKNSLTTKKHHDINFVVDICWNGREDKVDTDISVIEGRIVRVNESEEVFGNYIYINGEFVSEWKDYTITPSYYTCKSGILHAFKTLAKHGCKLKDHFFKMKVLVDFVQFVKSKHGIEEEELKKLSDVQISMFVDEFLDGSVKDVECCRVKLAIYMDVRNLEEELLSYSKRSEYEDAIRRHLKLYVKTDDRNYFTMDAPTLEIRFY